MKKASGETRPGVVPIAQPGRGQVRNDRQVIRSVSTAVPGLDLVLGGGVPEYSLNLIAGGPGVGKSTLAQQILFGSATAARPALYFTVLGEPTIKMLRYQSQFDFFDASLVGSAVQYVNLSEEVQEGELVAVLRRIEEEVVRVGPQIIVVDSFRTVDVGVRKPDAAMGMERFVQALAMHLTSWEVTSFVIGEYAEAEQRLPIFTVADGVLWLSQVTDRNSVVRKLQITKLRGRAPMPGLHTFRITGRGVQVFPRIPEQQTARQSHSTERQPSGVPGLDELLGGGIPRGDAVMLAGPPGSGKTTFATHFIAEGLRRGGSVVVTVFEEYPEEYLERARLKNLDLGGPEKEGRLKLIYLRPLDLSVDETLAEILDAVQKTGADRVVIDSLSGFEIALAPAFREDFRESLYRLIGALTATGVTVFMTAEINGDSPALQVTTERISFITDDILVQRFVEFDGQLRKVLAITKMRGSVHSQELRTYEISGDGAVVGGAIADYEGIMTGSPTRALRTAVRYPGLTPREIGVMETLAGLGSASYQALLTRTGVPADLLAPALDRVVALGYGTSQRLNGDVVYAAVAQRGTP